MSTLLTAGVAKRHYRMPSFPLNEARRDSEYFANATVWLRHLHFYGLTPRLNVSWQRYQSNHFLYNYQKNRVYLEVSKKF